MLNESIQRLNGININSLIETLFYTILILIFAIIIRLLLNKAISAIVDSLPVKTPMSTTINKARIDTVKVLLQNASYFLLSIVIIFMLLSQWGVDIMPLLASAGIAGLAIGFGAQTLVKDVISGFFIILEDQYNVGDKVDIGGTRGVVKSITLRTTIIEDEENNLVIIPNSQIIKVIRIGNGTN